MSDLSKFMEFVNATPPPKERLKWRYTSIHMMASSGLPIERLPLGDLSEAELRQFCDIRNTSESIRELMRGKRIEDMYPPGTKFTRDDIRLKDIIGGDEEC